MLKWVLCGHVWGQKCKGRIKFDSNIYQNLVLFREALINGKGGLIFLFITWKTKGGWNYFLKLKVANFTQGMPSPAIRTYFCRIWHSNLGRLQNSVQKCFQSSFFGQEIWLNEIYFVNGWCPLDIIERSFSLKLVQNWQDLKKKIITNFLYFFMGSRLGPPGTFHILIGKFPYFIIRFC